MIQLDRRKEVKKMNTFKYSNTNKRYHTLDYFYKNKFHSKISKISLNAGFTCPNIDGTVGYGGCIYCSKSGSGEFGGKIEDSLEEQFNKIKKVMDKKWKDAKYIAYFQARTNTYAKTEKLKKIYEKVLTFDNVIGINIATRPDSISDDCLELGLQTINEKTSILINRCHTLECFEKMVKRIREKNINVVVHIINGLPYENKEDMLNTIKYLNNLDIQGIKIHMLSIIKDTALEKLYKKEKFHILTKEEYIDIVINQLELLRPEIVIHRISGDPDPKELIEPNWLIKKFCVLNDIDKEMVKRNTYQGAKI